jgi:hypothetical protein
VFIANLRNQKMGNNIQSCRPSLTRDKFFPGNRLEGAVLVVVKDNIDNVNAIRLEVVGEAFFRWTTGSGKNRRTHVVRRIFSSTRLTLFGNYEATSGSKTHRLSQGQHVYPFAMILSPATLPSCTIHGGTLIKIQWYCRSVVDVSGRFDEAGACPFTVFSPIPHEIWMRNSYSSSNLHSKISCCCCISKGEFSAQAVMQKSILALDRDTLAWTVKIDNTKCTELIDEIEVSLICYAKPKIAATHRSTSQYFFQTKVKCHIAAGAQGEVSGTLPLRGGDAIPPTLVSAVIDFEWKVAFSISVDWATDPVFYIPVVIASTVLQDPFANVMMQQQQSFVPMAEQMLQQRNGMFEVQNQAQGVGVLPPPPPPPPGFAPMPQINWNMQPNNAYGNNNNDHDSLLQPMMNSPQNGGGGGNFSGYPGHGGGSSISAPSSPQSGGYPGGADTRKNVQFQGFAQFPDGDFFASVRADNREQ